jgi:uncharacterized protein DUF6788
MTRAAALRKRVHSLLLEQRELVRGLLRLRAQLSGSLFTRYGECGKEGCCCQQGDKHGPYYVLSSKVEGKSSFVYVAGEHVGEAKDLVTRSREFRKGLARLRKVNQTLVVALRQYQKLSVRSGTRKLPALSARAE